MKKDGILYKNMARYRIKFLIINIILTALFICYTINKMPYLKTAWGGPGDLDVERFISETSVLEIADYVELTRKDRNNPDASYIRETSYWQDDVYNFNIKLDKLEKTDIVFKGRVTSYSSGDVEEADMYELYFAEIGGRKAAVLAFAGQEVTENMTACIVHMQKPILSGISGLVKSGETIEICDYVIDVRGLEMDAASSDVWFFWIYLAGILYLYIKLIRYFINHLTTPTYKQLWVFGKIETVAEEIDRQAELPSARRNGKEYILDKFILTKGFMKMKVVANHLAKH